MTRWPTGRRRSRARRAGRWPSTPSGRPSGWAARRASTAGRSGRSRRCTRGCSRRRWTRRRRGIPSVPYMPVLIDATYAGLLTGATETPLVIPALNRDGDCLSDMVLPMFGSIAGAESILLAFDDDYDVDVAMAEAPHGTAPSLLGKDLANPMAMLLACGALLGYAGARRPSRGGAGLAGDLRERAGDDGDRREDHRPGRPRDHERVHQRRRREGPHEGRHLVDPRLALADQLARCALGVGPFGDPSVPRPVGPVGPRRAPIHPRCKIGCRPAPREPRRRAELRKSGRSDPGLCGRSVRRRS